MTVRALVALALFASAIYLGAEPVSATQIQSADSVYWPLERHDATRTGLNAEESALKPPLAVLWESDIADRTGARAGAIASDGLILTHRNGDAYALRASNGSMAWTMDGGEWPSAIDQGRAFLFGMGHSGVLQGLDLASGGLLWNREGVQCTAGGSCPYALGISDDEVFNGILGLSPTTGETVVATGSLFDCGGDEFAIHNGRYYVSGFRVGGRTLRACDIVTGNIDWETDIDTSQSGHIWPAVSGGRVYYVSNAANPDRGFLHSVDEETGQDLKEYSFLSHVNGSPALAYGRAYLSGDDGILRAVDTQTMTLSWSTALIGPIESSPAIANGVVYVTSDIGGGIVRLYGLDALNGDVLWSFDVEDSTTFTPSPIVANGLLILVTGGVANDHIYAFGNAPEGPQFIDIGNSVFKKAIEWLAAEGITAGCNPPDNNRFCPDDHVTRGQMAAFLVRAFGYTDSGGGDLFLDDDGSIFERAIDKLATAGVTVGCNPPDNNRFCPIDNVTRGQMAAFLRRAFGP